MEATNRIKLEIATVCFLCDDRTMQRLISILLAAIAPAQNSIVPMPPVLEAVPPPDSEEAQQRLAAEQSAALKRVARTRRGVTRTFVIGWEMHHGIYLVPAQTKDWFAAEWVTPDFQAGELRDRLATAASGSPDTAAHVGQRLVCRCTGVPWSFYGQKRFLIRQADLVWR